MSGSCRGSGTDTPSDPIRKALELVSDFEARVRAEERVATLREVEAWVRAEVPAGRYHADALVAHFSLGVEHE